MTQVIQIADTTSHENAAVQYKEGVQKFGEAKYPIILAPSKGVELDREFLNLQTSGTFNFISLLDAPEANSLSEELSSLDEKVYGVAPSGHLSCSFAAYDRSYLSESLKNPLITRNGMSAMATGGYGELSVKFMKALKSQLEQDLDITQDIMDYTKPFMIILIHYSAGSKELELFHPWHADFPPMSYRRVHRSITHSGMHVCIPGHAIEKGVRKNNQRHYEVSCSLALPTGLSVFDLHAGNSEAPLEQIAIHAASTPSKQSSRSCYFITGCAL